jgi:hypothetical protein
MSIQAEPAEVTGTNFDDQNYRLLRGKVYLECLEQFVLNELEPSAAEQDKVLILIATTIEIIDTAMDASKEMQKAFKGLVLEQTRQNGLVVK